MKSPNIVIKTNGINAKLFLDGKEIPCVRGYTIKHDAANLPVLQISLLATDVTLEGDMLPALPEAYRDFYVSKESLVASGILTEEQVELI